MNLEGGDWAVNRIKQFQWRAKSDILIGDEMAAILQSLSAAAKRIIQSGSKDDYAASLQAKSPLLANMGIRHHRDRWAGGISGPPQCGDLFRKHVAWCYVHLHRWFSNGA
jgi:hypothetical protein